MDEELALACQRKFEEENSRVTVVSEKRKLTWERLEAAAGAGAGANTGFRPAAVSAGISALENAAPCVVSC